MDRIDGQAKFVPTYLGPEDTEKKRMKNFGNGKRFKKINLLNRQRGQWIKLIWPCCFICSFHRSTASGWE
jgi:hypothetical protein